MYGRGTRARLRATMRSAMMAAGAAALAGSTLGASAAHALPGTRAVAEQRAHALVAAPSAALPAGTAPDCTGPAGDPPAGSQAWQGRDAVNQYCATERLQDEYLNPAFGTVFWTQTPAMYASQNALMLTDPAHPHVTLAQFVPGGTTTDPFRTLARWTGAGRGQVTPVSFPAADGATLNGYLFEPPAGIAGPHPGVVITTGSIQGYQQMYFWAAEGLAEAGYQVLTYDVQGQGASDTLPAAQNCASASSCQGVPFQQSYNFYQGAEDALNYFLSTPGHPYSSPSVPGRSVYNPLYADLDASRVGIAGHSLGASAVSEDGQCDPRVKAIVAWDNLATTSGPCSSQIPSGLPANAPADPSNTTPALGINSEYFFNPTPAQSPPDAQSRATAYAQLVGAGTDSMQVALRSSMHLEYSYVPYILPASHYGERVAFYYTLAWLDRYVRNDPTAFGRLTARAFDASSDAHSIGGGTYDPAAAAARPTDPAAGNVPTRIAGLPVRDRMSIYYDSEYSLTDPGAPAGSAKATCSDMRKDCAPGAPPSVDP